MSDETLCLPSCHRILPSSIFISFFAMSGVPFVHIPTSLPSSKLRSLYQRFVWNLFRISIPKLTRGNLPFRLQTAIRQVKAKEAFDKVEKAAAAVEAGRDFVG